MIYCFFFVDGELVGFPLSMAFLSLQDTREGAEEQSDGILRELSSNLLSIAKRHEGYQTLWNICCDLNDSELLRNLMVRKESFTTVLCV